MTRLLFLTQWFEPEPAFKGLVFAKALRDRGYEVEVLTGFPNYPGGEVYPGYRIRPIAREVVDGVLVTRVALYPSHDKSRLGRFFNYVSFALTASIGGLFAVKRPDVIYVYHPPATVALPALLLKLFKRSKVIYDIQDLWPDTLAATGMVGNPWILRIVGRWCRFVYRHVDLLIVLSEGFRCLLVRRGVPDSRIFVLRNWSPDEGIDVVESKCGPTPARRPEGQSAHGLTIIYAGNMGRAQNLSALMPAFADDRIRAAGVEFLLVGGGIDVEEIKEKVRVLGLSNVRVMPPVSKSRAAAMIREADIALVHLRPDPLFDITIPSKLQGYLMAGVPVLAGLRGEGMKLVEESKAGICFEPEQPQSLVQAILSFVSMPVAARRRMGRAGADYYQSSLSLLQATTATDAEIKKLVACGL